MSLPVPYLTYGYIYQDNGTTGIGNVTVTATSVPNSSSTTTKTDGDGKYIIDLQNIPVCDDGDEIKISISLFDFPYDSFTLDLSSGFKNINLTTSWDGINNDFRIYYDSLTGSDFIDCNCSRWDSDNYSITVETWLTKSQLKILRNNIVPGAAGELYQILSRPTFYDQTWEGNNTIRIVPNHRYNSNWEEITTIPYMRNEKLIYVKDISDSPIEGTSGYLSVKIEGYTSGSSDL